MPKLHYPKKIYENTWYIKATGRGLPTFAIGYYTRGFWQPVAYSFNETHANLIKLALEQTTTTAECAAFHRSSHSRDEVVLPENLDLDDVIWD